MSDGKRAEERPGHERIEMQIWRGGKLIAWPGQPSQPPRLQLRWPDGRSEEYVVVDVGDDGVLHLTPTDAPVSEGKRHE